MLRASMTLVIYTYIINALYHLLSSAALLKFNSIVAIEKIRKRRRMHCRKSKKCKRTEDKWERKSLTMARECIKLLYVDGIPCHPTLLRGLDGS